MLVRRCRCLAFTRRIKQWTVDDLAGRHQPRPLQLALIVDLSDKLIPNSAVRHLDLRKREVCFCRGTPGSRGDNADLLTVLQNERMLGGLIAFDIEQNKPISQAFFFLL